MKISNKMIISIHNELKLSIEIIDLKKKSHLLW